MDNISPAEVRDQIIGGLGLLADVRQQWDYELRVPSADVPAELFETASEILEWTAEFPDLFSTAEQEAIERVGWLVAECQFGFPIGLIEMQHEPAWTKVMEAARVALLTCGPDLEWIAPEDLAEPNPIGTWGEYFASVEKAPLHPLYAELDKYLPAQGDAFELACGLGKGTLHLVDKGLDVWATDVHGEALTYLYEHASADQRSRLHLYLSTFETLDLAPDSFDVVVAAFCLFFMPPQVFAEKWPVIVGSVRAGGLFMGQFLGKNDDWASMGYISHTCEEVEELLSGFEILHLEEVDRDGKTSQGTDKHWHIFHVIARKA